MHIIDYLESAYLQSKYDCNIIPLGAIEVGGFMERALLFKVLADRIGLPSTLCMDETNNRSVWNEVAIPMYEEIVSELYISTGILTLIVSNSTECFIRSQEAACGDLAKMNEEQTTVPTHIVDLYQEIGQLYTIGCKRAEQYLVSTKSGCVN